MEPHGPASGHHTHRRQPSNRRTEKILGIALAGVLVVAGLVFAVGEGLIHWDRKARPAGPVTKSGLDIPDDIGAAARAAVERFFEAPDLNAKAAASRDSSRIRPLMEDYYRVRLHPLPTMGRLSKPAILQHGDGTPLVFFEIEGFEGRRTPLAVAWDGKRFAVDWESMVAYGTMDWRTFLERQPSIRQTLRVFVETADESEHVPGAPEGVEQFRVWHRDHPQPVIAIAESSLAIGKVVTGKRQVPLTLEIEWRPVGPGRAAVPTVVRFVAATWSR